MNMRKLMSSRQILKWIIFGAVAMVASNGVMSASVNAIQAKDIVAESTLLDQMKILVYANLITKKLASGNKTESGNHSKILTDKDTATQIGTLAEIDAWKGQDLWNHLNFIFKIELLPEILTKIVSGEIKDAEIQAKGFKTHKTKQAIIDLIKKGDIKGVYDDFTPLKDGSTDKTFIFSELKNTDYPLTLDLKKELAKIEGKEILNAEKITHTSATGVCTGTDKAFVMTFLNCFNKKFFGLRSTNEITIEITDMASSPDDLKKIGLNIEKYSNIIKKDTDKFYTESDYTAAVTAAKTPAGGPTPTGQTPATFNITEVTKKEQVESLFSETNKKAIKDKLNSSDFKGKKDSDLSADLKAQKEALELALSLETTSMMKKVGIPAVTGLLGLGSGFAIKAAMGGNSNSEQGSQSDESKSEEQQGN